MNEYIYDKIDKIVNALKKLCYTDNTLILITKQGERHDLITCIKLCDLSDYMYDYLMSSCDLHDNLYFHGLVEHKDMYDNYDVSLF